MDLADTTPGFNVLEPISIGRWPGTGAKSESEIDYTPEENGGDLTMMMSEILSGVAILVGSKLFLISSVSAIEAKLSETCN